MVELGHNGHPDMTVAKRLIKTRLWFPDMDARVERRVGHCQAGTKVTRRASIRRAMAGVGSRPLGTHQGRQVPVGGGGQVDQVPGVIGGVRYLRGGQHSSL